MSPHEVVWIGELRNPFLVDRGADVGFRFLLLNNSKKPDQRLKTAQKTGSKKCVGEIISLGKCVAAFSERKLWKFTRR
jgi:hypothetical protein